MARPKNTKNLGKMEGPREKGESKRAKESQKSRFTAALSLGEIVCQGHTRHSFTSPLFKGAATSGRNLVNE